MSAHVEQIHGDNDDAVALVEELGQATRRSSTWRSNHLPTALRVLIAAGELGKAEDFFRGVDVHATRDVNCVLTGQAILAEAKGDMEKARDLYEEATQRWTDYGFVLEEGQAHLGLARCLIALGDGTSGAVPLHKAQAIFTRLGAVSLLQETDDYIRQTEAAS